MGMGMGMVLRMGMVTVSVSYEVVRVLVEDIFGRRREFDDNGQLIGAQTEAQTKAKEMTIKLGD